MSNLVESECKNVQSTLLIACAFECVPTVYVFMFERVEFRFKVFIRTNELRAKKNNGKTTRETKEKKQYEITTVW